uniref:Uncharacterized protein n=1 Tax=Anguilla anguilla TaxID=7936 RepID=A0A0E9R0F9_ANGAN
MLVSCHISKPKSKSIWGQGQTQLLYRGAARHCTSTVMYQHPFSFRPENCSMPL